MKMTRILKPLVTTTLVLSSFLVGYVAYYTFWPFKTVTSTNAPWKVSPKEVKAGGEIKLDIQFCKYTTAPGKAHNYFQDSIIYYLPPSTSSAIMGCYDLKGFVYKVPVTLPPGEYKMVFVTDYAIHPLLRTITVSFETERFTIIK